MLPVKKTTSTYSLQDKRAAIACYAIHGNYVKCGKLLNIPDKTLNNWSKTDWWKNDLSSVREEKQDEIDAGIGKIIDLAISSVTDRLEDGDIVLDPKTGEKRYKAVSARDSATILGIAFDKQRILRNLPVSITSTVDSAKLLKLQHEFESLALKETKVIEGQVIED